VIACGNLTKIVAALKLQTTTIGSLLSLASLNRPAAAYLVFLIINSCNFPGSEISLEIVTEAISAIIFAQSFDLGGFHEAPIWLRSSRSKD
jgi:hypothetical protein